MNCPHCQQTLPANQSAVNCPFCGKELPLDHQQDIIPSPRVRTKWLTFFIVLFASPICCFIALALDLGFLAVLFGSLGSLITGLVCTRIIMRIFSTSGARRVLLYFAVGILMCGLSYFLSAVGCTAASKVTHHGI
jgi:hypothetical protein